MKSPKSILLVNRKNLLWLNQELIPLIKKKYDVKFVIVAAANQKKAFDNLLSKKDYFITAENLKENAYNSIKKEKEIIKEAKYFEQKYKINYLRDGLLQDREYSYKLIDNFKPDASFLFLNNKASSDYLEIIKEMNYYFNFFEKIFFKNKIDLLISRPDSLRGFALTSISYKNNIPTTFQTTTRENGYYMWTDGPYQSHRLIQHNTKKNKKIKKFLLNNKNDAAIASHAFKYNKRHLEELSFNGTFNSIVFQIKDRLNFLLKDIKKGKIRKRPSLIKNITRKINAYLENKYLQKIFENDFDKLCSNPFIYFPLPVEPEFSTHSLSKEFNNMHAILRQTAISMPIGYKLIVKEHTPNIGNKNRDFYLNLMRIPNITFASHSISGTKLIDKAKAICTIVGTSALEAAERGKKAILFGTSVEFLYLPNILHSRSFQDLPTLIKEALKKPSLKEVKNFKKEFYLYKNTVRENSFYAPNTILFDIASHAGKKIEEKQVIKAIKTLNNLYNFQKKNTKR